MYRPTPVAAALAALLLCSPGTSGGSVRAYSQKEICELANVVVVATVQSRQSDWLEDKATILTAITLSVDHVIAGPAHETVTTGTLGGTIGKVTQHFSGEPAMPVGSQYILLMSQKLETSIPLLIGGTFGARPVPTDTTLPTVETLRRQWQEACETASDEPARWVFEGI